MSAADEASVIETSPDRLSRRLHLGSEIFLARLKHFESAVGGVTISAVYTCYHYRLEGDDDDEDDDNYDVGSGADDRSACLRVTSIRPVQAASLEGA